ncbi:DUF1643 domain-containing protein [Neobacillus cucumis]|uniref:DUF1643 domain-containing protein n=1 Tax=Neobacillus cucumis TaxID=1740721 RepID=UPI002E22A168|nr:DUF1643 domain-containing protein [Neobacillus cucumis]
MVYVYKDYVIKEKIVIKVDTKNDLRYVLKVPLKNKTNKKILVIMKNPSKADREESDHTINNVLKFCYSEGFSTVYIMNLYSFYSTKPKGIAALINNNQESLAIGKDNDRYLKKILQIVNEVIVAWGGNTFGCTERYKSRIEQVTRIIKGKNLYYVESKSECNWYPRHAQVWSVNSNINMNNWIPPF